MHEVDLRAKPAALLECSPKGTVPVIRLADGRVIEESLDIMKWALAINDPEKWLDSPNNLSDKAESLISQNDGAFKEALDKYKYSARHPEHPTEHYRERAIFFLEALNMRLCHNDYLMGDRLTIADVAIFPFIRQFAHVDKHWFYASQYIHLIRWLEARLSSDIFLAVMQKK